MTSEKSRQSFAKGKSQSSSSWFDLWQDLHCDSWLTTATFVLNLYAADDLDCRSCVLASIGYLYLSFLGVIEGSAESTNCLHLLTRSDSAGCCPSSIIAQSFPLRINLAHCCVFEAPWTFQILFSAIENLHSNPSYCLHYLNWRVAESSLRLATDIYCFAKLPVFENRAQLLVRKLIKLGFSSAALPCRGGHEPFWSLGCQSGGWNLCWETLKVDVRMTLAVHFRVYSF